MKGQRQSREFCEQFSNSSWNGGHTCQDQGMSAGECNGLAERAHVTALPVSLCAGLVKGGHQRGRLQQGKLCGRYYVFSSARLEFQQTIQSDKRAKGQSGPEDSVLWLFAWLLCWPEHSRWQPFQVETCKDKQTVQEKALNCSV